MSDELHKGIIRLGGKPFRRIRKHVGETWKPDVSKKHQRELGPWCKACNITHGWRSPNLLTGYERRSGGSWVIMWICKKTGNVIKETPLDRGGK